MAEIKHTFQSGKMNKDLDERLVPQGQYRDALNIEVLTSDDGNVGSAQNIYGNKVKLSWDNGQPSANGRDYTMPTYNNKWESSYCVGSVTDEKNNDAYFFIAAPTVDSKLWWEDYEEVLGTQTPRIISGFTREEAVVGGPFHHDESNTIKFLYDDGSGSGGNDVHIGRLQIYKDMIVRYNSDSNKMFPVFTDIFRVEIGTQLGDNSGAQGTNVSIGTAFFDGEDVYAGSDEAPYDVITNVSPKAIKYIRSGMTMQFYKADGSEKMFVADSMNGLNGADQEITVRQVDRDSNIIYLDREVTGDLTPIVATYPAMNQSDADTVPISRCYAVFEAPKVLNFHRDLTREDKVSITGINVLDNLLIWTDGNSEPKKINLDRLKNGSFTKNTFTSHSDLLIDNPYDTTENNLIELSEIDSATDSGYIKDHITLIRRGPRTAPRLVMSRFENESIDDTTATYTAQCQMDFTSTGTEGELAEVGDQIWITYNGEASIEGTFNNGQVLEFMSSDGSLQVVAEVLVVQPSTNKHRVRIKNINQTIDNTNINWDISIVAKKPIFETKLGRFSYRYKYQDGEYSTFAPWSELAFIPGVLDFVPKKGYNLGMVNNLRRLKITDFIASDYQRPDDIVAIDILFKDTVSPNVYIVKSIRRGYDSEWNDDLFSNKGSDASGVVDITTELIHKTLPSSQSLRAWDNVPIMAKAQEIVGNRIVFANYEQNYDILNKFKVYPRAISDDHPGDLYPVKSVKSIRDYKVGVVFGDKYGRETPVMGIGGKVQAPDTDEGLGLQRSDRFIVIPDSVNIDKSKSSEVNKIQVELQWEDEILQGSASDWMEYYKYYIKEISNEYYNLVMDKWYAAEDGNVWLSFQSADRNKIDIETYLILKNKHGSQEPVHEEARYKVLAIQNEAPRYIKTTNRIIGRQLLDSDVVPDMSTTAAVFLDTLEYDNAFGDYRFEGVGWARIIGELGGITRFSKWVRVARMNDLEKSIKVVGTFGETANMSGDGMFGTSTGLSLSIEVRDAVEENRAEFEGRFFVKVFKDVTLTNQVMGTDVAATSYVNIDSFRISFISSEATNPAVNSEYQGDFSGPNENYNNNTASDGTNYASAAWTDYHGLGDGGNLGYCDYKLPTKSFWNWYWNTDSTETYNGGTAAPSSKRKGKWFIDDASWVVNNAGNEVAHNHHGFTANNTNVDGVDQIHFSAIGVANTVQEDPERVQMWNQLSQEGTLFRFRSDPGDNGDGNAVIYQVQSVQLSGDTDSWIDSRNHQENIPSNWLSQVYPGVGSISGNSCGECEGPQDGPECNRQTFLLNFSRLDDATVGLDLNHWDPRTAVAHDGSTTMFIEIVEVNYDELNTTDYSVGNAIWETEPKESVDIDLYYEATSAIPMRLNNDNINSFAPTGSSVIISDRPTALSNPVTTDYCYDPDSETATPIVKYATRDVVGLGQDDGASDTIRRYPIAIGDNISFTRSDGMVTEAEVVDHFVPVKNYKNIEPYQALETQATGGSDNVMGTITEVVVNYPLEVSTYKTSKEHNILCSVGHQQAGINIFYAATASIPEDFNMDDGKIYEVSSQTLDIEDGTFTGAIWWGIGSDQVGATAGNTGIGIYRCHSTADNEDQQSFTSDTHMIKFKEVTGFYRLNYKTYKSKVTLPWFNCYSFGNGLESDRIRDDFNAAQIDNGCKVSTGLESYRKENKGSGLIWSGIYNSTNGVNKLNEFNMAEAITKDLNPSYGSIQALKTRDTNLVAFCEDKVLQILANKDALYNADGSSNLTASNVVLGQVQSRFSGDYGISLDPESLAFDAYRMYFTDKQRGKVLRLSQDGLTPISDVGMSNYFRENLKKSNKLIGSFDTVKGEYNLTMINNVSSITVSFNEKTKGWPSFKSFVPDRGLSLNSEYITSSVGWVWGHHEKLVDTNRFYDDESVNSTIDVLFNDNPSSIKGFSSMNYEGSQARIHKWDNLGLAGYDAEGDYIGNLSDGEYYNMTGKDGWYVEEFNTDLQRAQVVEFINKENKWFSYIDGVESTLQNIDTSEFTVQGIGIPSAATLEEVQGCMDPSATNYNPNANVDNGSCVGEVEGCMDPNAFNYNPLANYDSGNCVPVVLGCMDELANNYNILANTPDGNCTYDIPQILGCLDDGAGTYGVTPIHPDGASALNFGCPAGVGAYGGTTLCDINETGVNQHHAETCNYPHVYGCMDPTADNYNPAATASDGSCIAVIEGCMDEATDNWPNYNYDPNANTPGECIPMVFGCMNIYALNFNPEANMSEPAICEYGSGCTDPTALNYDEAAEVNESTWMELCVYQQGCTVEGAVNYDPEATQEDGSCIGPCYGCMDPTAFNYNPLATIASEEHPSWTGTTVTNSAYYTTVNNALGYEYSSAAGSAAQSCTGTVAGECVPRVEGCTNITATNYNEYANIDDGSCQNQFESGNPFTVLITNFPEANNQWTDDNLIGDNFSDVNPFNGDYIFTDEDWRV